MTNDGLLQRLEALERQQALAETTLNRGFWEALDKATEIGLRYRTIECLVCAHAGSRGEWELLTDQCMFGGGRLERYRCPECDCIFGPLKFLDLPDDFVSADYRLLYSRYAESDSFVDEVRTFRSLQPGPGQLFLDYGCGGSWSRTVDELRAEGFDVWGYEPSAETSSAFVVNDRRAISARFDGIFSNNVVEHFRNPVRDFQDLHSLLKPGGRMAHSSPCYAFRYAHTRFHTLFLLGRSAERLAERTGFRVIGREEDGDYINLLFERLGD